MKKKKIKQSSQAKRPKIKNNTEYVFMRANEEFAAVFQLLFGEDFISPDELYELDSKEVYTQFSNDIGNAKFSRELIRDIKKLGILKTDGKKLFLCIENQTMADNKKIISIVLYNIMHLLSEMEKAGEVYPIITAIVSWGKDRYKTPLNARDIFSKEYPEAILDYQIFLKIPVLHIVDITEEEMKKLPKNMRYVAMGTQINFGVTREKMKEYMKEMKEMYNNGIEKNVDDVVHAIIGKTDGRTKSMKSGFFDYLDQEVAESEAKGIAVGKAEGKAENVKTLMNKMHCDIDYALDYLDISGEEAEKVKVIIKNVV